MIPPATCKLQQIAFLDGQKDQTAKRLFSFKTRSPSSKTLQPEGLLSPPLSTIVLLVSDEMETETVTDTGKEAPAIRALGFLFKITQVFLWSVFFFFFCILFSTAFACISNHNLFFPALSFPNQHGFTNPHVDLEGKSWN